MSLSADGTASVRTRLGQIHIASSALDTEAPVLEGLGLRNFGAHSSNAEYVNVSSIEPRLYMVTRLIVDISDGKVAIGE